MGMDKENAYNSVVANIDDKRVQKADLNSNKVGRTDRAGIRPINSIHSEGKFGK